MSGETTGCKLVSEEEQKERLLWVYTAVLKLYTPVTECLIGEVSLFQNEE